MVQVQPETSGSTPAVVAAWYEDPVDPAMLRYWDGERWTEHVRRRSGGTPPDTVDLRIHRVPDPAATDQPLRDPSGVAILYDGPVSGLRMLRRRLQDIGLEVRIVVTGMTMRPTQDRPGEACVSHWFEVSATGPYAEHLCGVVVTNWAYGGTISIL